MGIARAADLHFHVDDAAADVVAVGLAAEHFFEHERGGLRGVQIGEQQPVFRLGIRVLRGKLCVELEAIERQLELLLFLSLMGLVEEKPALPVHLERVQAVDGDSQQSDARDEAHQEKAIDGRSHTSILANESRIRQCVRSQVGNRGLLLVRRGRGRMPIR